MSGNDPQALEDDVDREPLGRRLGRKGFVTPILMAVISAALLLAAHEQGRGHYVRLRDAVNPQIGSGPSTGPGGPAPVVLSRSQSGNITSPEFLSATLLPGRGFNLWQITAYVPGRGEISLLASPPVERATDILTGTGTDSNGSAATEAGAAFLAPWADRLTGNPSSVGGLQASWEEQAPLFFPAQPQGATTSTHGLLLKQVADSVHTSTLTESTSALAVFHAQNFANQWPGSTDITIEVALSAATMDLTMTARNAGSSPEPIGLGWLPHFAIPSGRREDALLTIPASQHVSIGRAGTPSGSIASVNGTPLDFEIAEGTKLRDLDLDEAYVDLHSGALTDGPIAELRDPASGYGLRVLSASENITNLRVIAPAGKPWVSIGPNTNLPDPFGKEWKDPSSNGIITLQPGASIQWKVRLELFGLGTPLRAPLVGSSAPNRH